jgi:hypothetical protein
LRNPPQFPVIIGVTGHRSIAPGAVQPVKRAVKDVLESWRRQFGPALHVLTALADGADQLVADVAQECQVPIIAVAPFHMANYRSTLQYRDEFAAHWNNAALRLVLPDVGSDSRTDYRDRQYEQLGVLLIRRSHLLLGLWDGAPPAGRGGTADVIRMRIEGDHDAETLQDSPIFFDAKSYVDETNRGPLLHIFTPRDPSPDLPEPAPSKVMAGTCRLLGLPDFGSVSRPTKSSVVDWVGLTVDPVFVLKRITQAGVTDFMRVDDLNRTIGRFSGSDDLLFRTQLGYLNIAGIPVQAIAPAWFLKRLQAAVDTAAQYLRTSISGSFGPLNHPRTMMVTLYSTWLRTKRTPRVGAVFLFAMTGPLSVFLFELYAHHSREPLGDLALLIYIFVLGSAMRVETIISNENWYGRSQGYRELAEAMRVQLYWALSAVPAAVSDYGVRKQSDEPGWTQFALRGPALWAAATAAAVAQPQRETVKRGWFDDQAMNFGNRVAMPGLAEQKRRAWTLGSNSWALGLSALLLIFDVLTSDRSASVKHSDWLSRLTSGYHDYIVVLAATLPALAGSFSMSRGIRDYKHIAISCAVMRRWFGRAANFADKPGLPDDDFQDMAREIGRAALAENAQWSPGYRNRKTEPGS